VQSAVYASRNNGVRKQAALAACKIYKYLHATEHLFCSGKSVWPDQTLFSTVHNTTDLDSSFGLSFKVSGNIKSYEIS
jgi:hypothetical protein